MTGNIITNGTQAFTPIVDRLGYIVGEMLPYMLYIGLTCASILLAYQVVKMIINYLIQKNKSVFYYRDYEIRRGKKIGNSNGRPQYEVLINEKRVKRKKPKWKYFRRFR